MFALQFKHDVVIQAFFYVFRSWELFLHVLGEGILRLKKCLDVFLSHCLGLIGDRRITQS